MPDSEAQRAWRKRNREHLREYQRRWKQAHPDKMREYRENLSPESRARRLAYHSARKAEQRAAINAYKREQGCIDCGTHEGRLEFDHRPGEDKAFNIPHGLGCAWEKIWAEIAKCDVRCARCHRRRHTAVRAAEGTAVWMTRQGGLKQS